MSENAVVVRTYGNWREPKAAGFGKLSFAASMGLLAAMIGAVLIYTLFGMRWALVFAAVSAGGLWAVSSKDRHGMSVADRTGTLMRYRRAKRRKATIYRSGPLSVRATQGTCTLPGILSGSTLSEHVDAGPTLFFRTPDVAGPRGPAGRCCHEHREREGSEAASEVHCPVSSRGCSEVESTVVVDEGVTA